MTTNGLAVGSHTITARYGGDATFRGGDASPVTQHVDTTLSGYSTLSDVSRKGTYLWGWDLSAKDLSNCTLSGAVLTNANVRNANLSDSNLSGADLVGANLTAANLKGATGLTTATLTDVVWNKTTCPNNTSSYAPPH